jgi:arylsulfatase A-like enzyme
MAWLVVAPAAVGFAILLVIVKTPARPARFSVALVAATFAALVGYGITQGRHFAALPVRALFIGALAALAFALAFALGPRLGRAVEKSPGPSAAAAALVAVVLDAANCHLLPRLYPAFHFGLTALTAMTACLIARGLGLFDGRAGPRADRQRKWAAAILATVSMIVVARAPSMAGRLMRSDNLRLIFLERAPLLGLGVELASRLASTSMPVAALADDGGAPDDRRLAVDWRGRDILLISVDALRADHVGAYGYGRPTTPHLDALAQEGTLFGSAYCPTPHTSYSITSMMTGKPLRSLLALGLGADSDTLAGILRAYGYRTAAFYPPAVFFVDGALFAAFESRRLDFEYTRVEFAQADERARALREYVASQPGEQRVLLWVHLFEPHEPYIFHPEHPFGSHDVDRYDSEIALADDGIGEIVAAVRATRPNTVIIVTADHGEEFGEHHGRYHGTTVYEEQVRVPLVVVTPGLAGGRRIEAPVQTIDILPTVLSALDIPRPPRIRGNDLGHWLASAHEKGVGGLDRAEPPLPPSLGPPPAFAETDEQVLLADAAWRLVCTRRAAACALYNLELDPGETRDLSREHGDRLASMKAALHRMEAAHGRYEGAGAGADPRQPWPEAIRRGMAGDGDAAPEIAALLDDIDVVFRRKAAELLFDLKREETAAELRLSLARDDDAGVRAFCALALTRLGQTVPRTIELFEGTEEPWRRLAALALAENGDGRGAAVLVSWWQTETPSFERARELLSAMARIKAKAAVPLLVRSLDDIRLRPYVAGALGAIGQRSARIPLAERFAAERHQNTRTALVEALVRLGASAELVGPLVRFLGTPDPLPNGLDLAIRAGVLSRVGGPNEQDLRRLQTPSEAVALRVVVPPGGNGSGRRLIVRAHLQEGQTGQIRVEIELRHTVTLEVTQPAPTEQVTTLPPELGTGPSALRLEVAPSREVAIDAIAVVPLSDELPPPLPEPWHPPGQEPLQRSPVARIPAR